MFPVPEAPHGASGGTCGEGSVVDALRSQSEKEADQEHRADDDAEPEVELLVRESVEDVHLVVQLLRGVARLGAEGARELDDHSVPP